MMRMMWQPLKFTTREGSKAAYVNSLFKIEHVIFVTSLHDTASKRKDQQKREKKQQKNFETLLHEACADTQTRFLIRQMDIQKTVPRFTTLKNAGSMYTNEQPCKPIKQKQDCHRINFWQSCFYGSTGG